MSEMMSSENPCWETPDELFDSLHREFKFTLDCCASLENAKLPRFFSELENGLVQKFRGETVWCNPPYGREIHKWIEKVIMECETDSTAAVVLVPSRTDTVWFQTAMMFATSVCFVKGRLTFKGAAHGAPFPSALFTFNIEPSASTVLGDIGILVRL